MKDPINLEILNWRMLNWYKWVKCLESYSYDRFQESQLMSLDKTTQLMII